MRLEVLDGSRPWTLEEKQMRKRNPVVVFMALVLLVTLGLPGLLLGIFVAPWFFLLLLLMMFAPLVFLLPSRAG